MGLQHIILARFPPAAESASSASSGASSSAAVAISAAATRSFANSARAAVRSPLAPPRRARGARRRAGRRRVGRGEQRASARRPSSARAPATPRASPAPASMRRSTIRLRLNHGVAARAAPPTRPRRPRGRARRRAAHLGHRPCVDVSRARLTGRFTTRKTARGRAVQADSGPGRARMSATSSETAQSCERQRANGRVRSAPTTRPRVMLEMPIAPSVP